MQRALTAVEISLANHLMDYLEDILQQDHTKKFLDRFANNELRNLNGRFLAGLYIDGQLLKTENALVEIIKEYALKSSQIRQAFRDYPYQDLLRVKALLEIKSKIREILTTALVKNDRWKTIRDTFTKLESEENLLNLISEAICFRILSAESLVLQPLEQREVQLIFTSKESAEKICEKMRSRKLQTYQSCRTMLFSKSAEQLKLKDEIAKFITKLDSLFKRKSQIEEGLMDLGVDNIINFTDTLKTTLKQFFEKVERRKKTKEVEIFLKLLLKIIDIIKYNYPSEGLNAKEKASIYGLSTMTQRYHDVFANQKEKDELEIIIKDLRAKFFPDDRSDNDWQQSSLFLNEDPGRLTPINK